MLLLPRGTKRHIAGRVELLIAYFVPAAIVDEHKVETINIDPVTAELSLGKINVRKLELIAFEVRLDARISHAMMTELRGHVVLDDFAACVTNRSERKIPPEGVGCGGSQQMLQAAFDRFHNLRRDDPRLRRKIKLPDVGRSRLNFENSHGVTSTTSFRSGNHDSMRGNCVFAKSASDQRSW